MEVIQLYLPSYACIDKLSDTEEFQKIILKWIDSTTFSTPDGWECNVKSTFSTQNKEGVRERNLLELDVFKTLRTAIELSFSKFYKKIFDHDGSFFSIEESWINVYEKGHFQESHAHKGSFFSGSYYVKVPKGSGAIVLEGEGNSERWITPEEGSVLFFEGEMPHRVEANQSNEQRISLSFNIE
jgi:hypothetical protein